MFRLHGSPISNYYNIAKLSLMDTGLDFEEVIQPPSQKEDYLSISPLGIIPVLQVKEGYISETIAIVEFLEDVYPEIPLYPKDAFGRAMARRLCHMAEIYLDLPARPLLMADMTGQPVTDAVKQDVRQALEKGTAGLARVAAPAPFLLGREFTAADIFLYYCLGLVAPIVTRHLALAMYDLLPGFADWREQVAAREFVREVDAANRKAVEAFLNRQKQQG